MSKLLYIGFLSLLWVATTHGCPQVLAEIATHIGLSALPADKAEALRDYASKLEVVLEGDEHLGAGCALFWKSRPQRQRPHSRLLLS
ncbi:MAG: hypothetical protein R3B54_01385 [Bdellovibrionota bacterium]